MATLAGIDSFVRPWGNGLGLRLTKPVAEAAGLAADSAVRISAEPGRIVIELKPRPTLEALLAGFDRGRHGGEEMAFTPVGKERVP